MRESRRIYRRVVTTERVVMDAVTGAKEIAQGERFRVEVIDTTGPNELKVYSRQFTGRIDVEETADGDFHLIGSKIS